MKHWFRDQHFRSLLKNASYLAISRAVAAVGGLITLALAARGLGVAMFGLLILIHSYAQAASGLTKFNTWQIVVRYGGPALEKGDTRTFKHATGFALGLDLASGLATMVGAMLLLPLVAGWFGIPPDYVTVAVLYCTLLPVMGAATASGILRTFDRFDLLSWQGTIQPNLRAALTFVAWLNDWPFLAYVGIWFATDLIGDLCLWVMAARELRRRKLASGIRPSLSARGLERGWPFAISINLNQSLNTAWGPIARLLVGGLLGPASAGLYRVASSIADAAQKPADFLNKAFYPEVMRLDPGSKTPWKLMTRTIAVAGAASIAMILLVALAGEPLLSLAFGREFAGAYAILMVLLGVPLIATISFPIPAMLHAIDRTNVPLFANIAGAALYVALIFPLVEQWGLIGAGLAFVIGRLMVVTVMAAVLGAEHKKLRGR